MNKAIVIKFTNLPSLRPLRFSVSFALLVFKISGKAATQGTQRTAKDAELGVTLFNHTSKL